MTKAVYIVRGIAATVTLCRTAAAHIRGSYEVLHGQVLAAATYEVLKQLKIYDFGTENSRFVRICVIMSSIDFWKKVIFANLVTYEVLQGQRRYVTSM